MFKDFESCFEYFLETKKLKSTTDLEGVERLIEYLDLDISSLKIVHVAGTNGKGSTIAFIENTLVKSKYKVGKYISPAVIDELECICINKNKISKENFLRLFNIIYEQVENIVKAGYPHPTYFEIETVLAFIYFIEQNVDIALIECGLGGIFDSTNVIKNPLISVLTNISLDHVNILGNTLEEITKVKCGIIKNNCLTITNNEGNILDIIEKEASLKNSVIIKVDTNIDYEILDNKNVFTYEGNNFNTCLIGKYQINNACLAITVLKELEKFGFNTKKNLIEGINNATNFGRLTKISDNPIIYVDGAHNEAGALALRDSLKKFSNFKKINLLICIFKDKEYKKIVQILTSFANKVVVTNVNSERALDKDILKNEVLQYTKNVISKNSPKEAIRYLIKNTTKEEMIICAGTLSHISEIRAEVMKNGQ